VISQAVQHLVEPGQRRQRTGDAEREARMDRAAEVEER
jgi:hypothetical protein